MLKNLIFYYLILLELVILLEQRPHSPSHYRRPIWALPLDVRCNFTFVVSCAPHLKHAAPFFFQRRPLLSHIIPHPVREVAERAPPKQAHKVP